MTCGWLTGAQCAMNGRLDAGVQTPGEVLRMILGSPVDPELQIPLTAGETAIGSGASDRVAASCCS